MSCYIAIRLLLTQCLSLQLCHVDLVDLFGMLYCLWVGIHMTSTTASPILLTLHACSCLLLSGRCPPIGPDSLAFTELSGIGLCFVCVFSARGACKSLKKKMHLIAVLCMLPLLCSESHLLIVFIPCMLLGVSCHFFCCLVGAAGSPRSVVCIGTLGVHCRRLICSTFHFIRFALIGKEPLSGARYHLGKHFVQVHCGHCLGRSTSAPIGTRPLQSRRDCWGVCSCSRMFLGLGVQRSAVSGSAVVCSTSGGLPT